MLEEKMPNTSEQRPAERMIHVRLPLETHKRLRIRAAELDTTIQDWVATVVTKELQRQGNEKSS